MCIDSIQEILLIKSLKTFIVTPTAACAYANGCLQKSILFLNFELWFGFELKLYISLHSFQKHTYLLSSFTSALLLKPLGRYLCCSDSNISHFY